MLDTLRRDLAYALRGFRREPGFTIIAVVILALGIGANTAVFSVVNPLLLRPLPFAESDRLVWIDNHRAGRSDGDMSGRTYRVAVWEEMQREARSFSELSAFFAFFGFENFTLTGRGEPERLAGVQVAPRFFELLGVQPAHGRLFTREEEATNGPRAAVISHTLWLRQFAANPAVVGQAISINNLPVTVVGILPEDFDFAATFTPGVRVDFFLPANLKDMRNWGNTLAIVGRLKPGVSVASAAAEMKDLMPRLNAAHKDWGRVEARVQGLKDYVSGQMRRSLVVLWAAVGLVLLIVCANLSNLLLARTAGRRKEIAVRMALGAGRMRIIRQLLTEGVVLALAGAALGVPLAYGLTMFLRGVGTLSIPLLHQVRVDGVALLFTGGVAIAAGLTFGMIPALRLVGRDPHGALKEQSRGSTDGRAASWLRSTLVVAEVTLACVLLVGAGLLLRSFFQILQVDLGFRTARVFAMKLDTRARQGLTDEQRQALIVDVVDRVRAIPGVEAAGTTDALPLDRNRSWGVGIPGQTYDGRSWVGAFVFVTGPGYLKAMSIPLKAGRDFSTDDTPKSAPALMINETLAKRLFGTENPLGRAVNGDPKNPYRVVGVVADVRQTGLDEAPVTQMYVAQAQQGGDSNSPDLIVRSSLPAASIAAGVRAVLGAVDPSMLTTDFRPIDLLVERAVSPRRFLLTLLGGFSVLALVLACLGIYGVVSYGVSQRTQEIGVRMALGATAADVGRQVIGGTVRLAAIGVALGLLVSLPVAQLIASLLFGTSPTDAMTFFGTGGILLLVAIAAGAVPALRAARVDPMSALRAD